MSDIINDSVKVKPSMIHIGLGAFHRAHQAYYLNEYAKLNITDTNNWSYLSVTIRSNEELISTLEKQNCIYTLVERSYNTETYTSIRSIKEALFAGNGNVLPLIQALCAPTTKIVTYTVTEKGYYFNLNTQQLDVSDADIQYDIENFATPKTAIGITVRALYLRYTNQQQGLTLLSCDNMPDNGKVLKVAVLQFARHIDKDFTHWIEESCTFPCSMVDRIVPAATNELLRSVEMQGIDDNAPIATESFTQWVVEDWFVNNERPALEKVGVEFVKDVEPYEVMKLKMLNGSHSILAYIGAIVGLKTVDVAVADTELFKLIQYYMLQVAAPYVVGLPKEVDLKSYADSLLLRFKNPNLKHKTIQIAIDGSKKLPQRWLTTLEQQINGNDDIRLLCFALAVWILFTKGMSEHDEIIEVNDPLIDIFKNIHQTAANNDQLVKKFFAIDSIFSNKIASDSSVQILVVKYLDQIKKQGVYKSLKQLNEELLNA